MRPRKSRCTWVWARFNRCARSGWKITDCTASPIPFPPKPRPRINRALDAGRRVVAVGTTTVRTLEYSAAEIAAGSQAGSGEADIFIYPGYEFRVVGALLTNFHLPQSTLLMLVCAFAGQQRVLDAYRHAVAERYRFYSYGDCMLVE